VVTTSDYAAMRQRILDRIDQQQHDAKDDRPRLRVTPGSGTPAQQDGNSDDPPTVRRRDLLQ